MTLDLRAMELALPNYEIGREIGRGAFGVVFEGRHKTLGRRVAIKQLPRAYGADPALRARFLTEAQVVASLDHPHIVPVYDYIEHDGLRLLVMEHLGGGTLATRAAEGRLSTEAACAVAIAVCLGLQHAHERGILHRDVKPENIAFAKNTPKLADFGIAKSTFDDARLTMTGSVIGTVAYMSPEQATGDPLSPASDVYSCALMVYEQLAGRLPYAPVPSITAQLVQHVTATPEPLLVTAPNVPPVVGDVIMRGLAKSPADRPASAAAFASQLAGACRRSFGDGWLRTTGIDVVGLDRLAVEEPVVDPSRLTTVPSTPVAVAAPPTVTVPRTTRVDSAERKGRRAIIGAGAIAAILAGGGIVVALNGRSSGSTTSTVPATTVVEPTTVGTPATTVAAPATTAPPTAPPPTPAPTAAPTVAPTAAPTVAPTVALTVKPVVPAPTPPPTAPPTAPPTPAPTAPPTAAPTVAPTVPPTAAPTAPPATAPPTAPPATAPPVTVAVVGPVKAAIIKDLVDGCTSSKFPASACSCLQTKAESDLTVKQLSAMRMAVRASLPVGPQAKLLLQSCGFTPTTSAAAVTPTVAGAARPAGQTRASVRQRRRRN